MKFFPLLAFLLVIALTSCGQGKKTDPSPAQHFGGQVINVAVRDSETKVGFVTAISGVVYLYSGSYSDNDLVGRASDLALDPRLPRSNSNAAWLVADFVDPLGVNGYADTLGHFSRRFLIPDSVGLKPKGFIIWHFLNSSPTAVERDVYTYTFLGQISGKPENITVTVDRQRAGL